MITVSTSGDSSQVIIRSMSNQGSPSPLRGSRAKDWNDQRITKAIPFRDRILIHLRDAEIKRQPGGPMFPFTAPGIGRFCRVNVNQISDLLSKMNAEGLIRIEYGFQVAKTCVVWQYRLTRRGHDLAKQLRAQLAGTQSEINNSSSHPRSYQNGSALVENPIVINP